MRSLEDLRGHVSAARELVEVRRGHRVHDKRDAFTVLQDSADMMSVLADLLDDAASEIAYLRRIGQAYKETAEARMPGAGGAR